MKVKRVLGKEINKTEINSKNVLKLLILQQYLVLHDISWNLYDIQRIDRMIRKLLAMYDMNHTKADRYRSLELIEEEDQPN